MPKKKKSNIEPQSEDIDFEEALGELEAIVRRLEHGGGSLEKALEEYGTAIGLMKMCHKKLENAERRVELLSGVDAEGNPVSQPLDSTEESTDLEQKRKARSNKRSAKPSSESEGGLF